MPKKIIVAVKGNSKSGNYGHAGIPGHQGGSAPSGKGRSVNDKITQAVSNAFGEQGPTFLSKILDKLTGEKRSAEDVALALRDRDRRKGIKPPKAWMSPQEYIDWVKTRGY